MKKVFIAIALLFLVVIAFIASDYNKSETIDNILAQNTELDYNNLVSIEILTGNLQTYVITDKDKIKEFTTYMNGFKLKNFIKNSIINKDAQTSPDNMACKISINDISGNKVTIDPAMPIMKINGKYYKVTSGEINKNFFIDLIQEIA